MTERERGNGIVLIPSAGPQLCQVYGRARFHSHSTYVDRYAVDPRAEQRDGRKGERQGGG